MSPMSSPRPRKSSLGKRPLDPRGKQASPARPVPQVEGLAAVTRPRHQRSSSWDGLAKPSTEVQAERSLLSRSPSPQTQAQQSELEMHMSGLLRRNTPSPQVGTPKGSFRIQYMGSPAGNRRRSPSPGPLRSTTGITLPEPSAPISISGRQAPPPFATITTMSLDGHVFSASPRTSALMRRRNEDDYSDELDLISQQEVSQRGEQSMTRASVAGGHVPGDVRHVNILTSSSPSCHGILSNAAPVVATRARFVDASGHTVTLRSPISPKRTLSDGAGSAFFPTALPPVLSGGV